MMLRSGNLEMNTNEQNKTASPVPGRKANVFQGVHTVQGERFSFAPKEETMSVATELHIVKQLQAVLPVLTAEEKTQLEANLKRDKEKFAPIVFWYDGEKDVIVDGMHSWPIIKKLGMHYTTKELTFADYDEAEIWILEHALGTRGLSPQAQKILRGTLYNKQKAKCGDANHFLDSDDPLSDAHSEHLEKTAEKVAKQTGVSRATVVRDGSYVTALEKVPKSIRDAISSGKIKPASDELKRLASVTEDDQVAVARSLHVGQSQTLSEAMTKCGITKAKPKSTGGKQNPPKQYDRSFWFKQWDKAIGPLVRLVDKIAKEVGESKSKQQNAVHAHLNHATEEMMAWMGVKKR